MLNFQINAMHYSTFVKPQCMARVACAKHSASRPVVCKCTTVICAKKTGRGPDHGGIFLHSSRSVGTPLHSPRAMQVPFLHSVGFHACTFSVLYGTWHVEHAYAACTYIGIVHCSLVYQCVHSGKVRAWFKVGLEKFHSSRLPGSASFLCAELTSSQRTKPYCPQIEQAQRLWLCICSYMQVLVSHAPPECSCLMLVKPALLSAVFISRGADLKRSAIGRSPSRGQIKEGD